MQITDTEVMLMAQGHSDRRYAAQQIALANGEIRRLRHLLAQAQADLDAERAARVFAEYQLNRRH